MICATRMLAKWLKENGYDGLFNPDVPCACLIADLAPCDELGGGAECFAGYRKNYGPTEVCGCDGQGTSHFHIVGERPE